MRVLVPVRALINFLEARGMLDMNVQHVVGPFALLMEGLMQVGLDRLLLAWNEHDVRPRKGEPGTGGRPSKRARARPHPGGQMQLPPGFDGVAAYEAAFGPTRRLPEASAAWDRLTGQPILQAQRDVAVLGRMGDKVAMWNQIVVGQYDDFIACFAMYVAMS